jgi:S-adenosylmethionine:tRNA ribosyltransferase-isomerase
MRTEDRPPPPALAAGDKFVLGPLHATVERILSHPRLVRLVFDGSSKEILEGLAHHGRPIQYSHVKTPLALWDVWTPIAGPPVAFESPSAGFALEWRTLASLKERGVRFMTITLASGISSTGDLELDARLPFDEPYCIPLSTASAIRGAQVHNERVIAVGTSVVRALEDAAALDGSVLPGERMARRRIESGSRLRVVDAMLSGTHEPGTTHHELLRAFVYDETLARLDRELKSRGYFTHEFGDSVFVERIERPFVRAGLTFGAAHCGESRSDPQDRRMRAPKDQ